MHVCIYTNIAAFSIEKFQTQCIYICINIAVFCIKMCNVEDTCIYIYICIYHVRPMKILPLNSKVDKSIYTSVDKSICCRLVDKLTCCQFFFFWAQMAKPTRWRKRSLLCLLCDEMWRETNVENATQTLSCECDLSIAELKL